MGDSLKISMSLMLAWMLFGCRSTPSSGGGTPPPPSHYMKSLTLDELDKEYEKKNFLGGGGHAAVFEAVKGGQTHALRVDMAPLRSKRADVFPKEQETEVIKDLSENKNKKYIREYLLSASKRNPHIVEFRSIFLLKAKTDQDVSSKLKDSKIKDSFFEAFTQDSNAPNLLFYQVELMEKLEGTITDDILKENWGQQDKDFYLEFIKAYIDFDLAFHKIMWVDGKKYSNWGYIANEENFFQGKKVSDYKYWCYTLGNLKLYVPIGKYTIKRIDPDVSYDNSPPAFDDAAILERLKSLAQDYGSPGKKWEEMLALPEGVDENEILYVPE